MEVAEELNVEELKEFNVRSRDLEGNPIQGFVKVSANHSLSHVRNELVEEWDEDMFPADRWYFSINGRRVSEKQEAHMKVHEVGDTKVSLHSRKKRSLQEVPEPLPSLLGQNSDNTTSNANKRARLLRYGPPQISQASSPDGVSSASRNHAECIEPIATAATSSAVVAGTLSLPSFPRPEDVSSATPGTSAPINHPATPLPDPIQYAGGTLSGSHGDQEDEHTEAKYCIETHDVVCCADFPKMEENPHFATQKALQVSEKVLVDLESMLERPNNAAFCSDARRQDWLDRISDLRDRAAAPPKITIGVLGDTGVGKSSLLNALLNEADVLPTSGSRACTAVVIELSFNRDLLPPEVARPGKVPVYKGEIEFMTNQDWLDELAHLVEECAHKHKKNCSIYEHPTAHRSVARNAWQKLEQVYGKAAMSRCKGRPVDRVFKQLSTDSRIKALLDSSDDSQYKSILIEEGEVTQAEARRLLQPYSRISDRLKRCRSEWATEVRKKIDGHVHCNGDVNEPQSWPLVRRVRLYGPWTVLSTGACLVDLPGFRDANEARAEVTKSYMKNCKNLWIAAPIKRAVNDKAAKKMMGKQWKRQVLMDGNYGNITFVCTQTDNLEVMEIKRDHEDVARDTGSWEEMEEVSEAIRVLQDQINEKKDGEPGLTTEIERAKWTKENLDKIQKDELKCRSMQIQLRGLCALVRNTYSKKCLGRQFRQGLEEVSQKHHQAYDADMPSTHIHLKIFCVSSNDYLKHVGIKSSSDGPPGTFLNADDTEIPMLRIRVHETTSSYCTSFVRGVVNDARSILDGVNLLALDEEKKQSIKSAQELKATFGAEKEKFQGEATALMEEFKIEAQKGVLNIETSVKIGAEKSESKGWSTVVSWGDNENTRTSQNHPGNGLHYNTYEATIRRLGVFTSSRVGDINFNEELLEPMEIEFSPDWQEVMNSFIPALLDKCHAQIVQRYKSLNGTMSQGCAKCEMDPDKTSEMVRAANHCHTFDCALNEARENVVEEQRNLNRSILPVIQSRMTNAYKEGLAVQKGVGSFERMKKAVEKNAQEAIDAMFSESGQHLLGGVSRMLDHIAGKILKKTRRAMKEVESLYSVYWEEHTDEMKARACRDALLPEISSLCEVHREACQLLDREGGGMDEVEATGPSSSCSKMRIEDKPKERSGSDKANLKGSEASSSDDDESSLEEGSDYVPIGEKPTKNDESGEQKDE